MTTAQEEAPVKSHEAARGARRAALTAIDLDYARIVAEVNEESARAWDAAVAASCARIDEAMQGLIVDTEGHLIGNPLRVRIASTRIVTEIDLMCAEWYGQQFRLAMALDEIEAGRLAERASFDFDMTPRPADVEVSQEIPADPSLTTSEPEASDAIQWGAENFGAPMNCIWIDAPLTEGAI